MNYTKIRPVPEDEKNQYTIVSISIQRKDLAVIDQAAKASNLNRSLYFRKVILESIANAPAPAPTQTPPIEAIRDNLLANGQLASNLPAKIKQIWNRWSTNISSHKANQSEQKSPDGDSLANEYTTTTSKKRKTKRKVK